MRGTLLLCAVLLLAIVVPSSLPAAEQETNFRHRISADDEVNTADISEESRFGREVAARIIGRYGMYDNPMIMKYVNLVGKTLALHTNRPEIEFRVAVLNTDELNAYAAPGGYIFITRGALAKMQNEAELAGVIAHEIGHVVEKHVVKELNIKGTEKSAATGLAMLIGGTSEPARLAFSQALDTAIDMLFKNGYKREDETQADKDAVIFCALSGYDPTGLSKYLDRIKEIKGKNTEILDKTHPPIETRTAWITETIANEGIDLGVLKDHKDRFTNVMKSLK